MGGDPLELITEGREKLAVEDRRAWSSAALSDRMLAVAAERERLDAEFLRLTAEWDTRGAWGDDGFASASSWLAGNARMPRASAGRVLRSARHVHRFATTGDALAEGTVTTDKVDALAESARHREEFYERDEVLLLDIATRLDSRDLTVALRTWRNLADDELADEDASRAFERVHLDVANGLLGSELAGFLDPEGSAMLTRALDLLEPPDPMGGPDMPRALSQRRGEGLVKLARHYLDGRTGAGRATPSIEVVFTPQDDARVLEDHRCEITGFGAVPLDTVRRLACEARIGWLVVNGEREVLDMGRSVRTPSAGQRRHDRGARSPLQVPGVPGSGGMVRRPPPRRVGTGRCDRPRQPRVAVPSSPSEGPRGAATAGPRSRRNDPARTASNGGARFPPRRAPDPRAVGVTGGGSATRVDGERPDRIVIGGRPPTIADL